jgi:hypothetical protein
MKSRSILRLVVFGVALLTGLVACAQVVASAPYTVSVFATSIPGRTGEDARHSTDGSVVFLTLHSSTVNLSEMCGP